MNDKGLDAIFLEDFENSSPPLWGGPADELGTVHTRGQGAELAVTTARQA